MNKSPPYKQVRVYSYGCLRPSIEDEKTIFSLLRLANAFQNHLVLDVEQEARSIYRNKLQSELTSLAKIDSDIANLYKEKEEAVKLAKASGAGRRVKGQPRTDPALKAKVDEIKTALTVLKEKRKEILANPENQESRQKAADLANSFRSDATKVARNMFGPKVAGLPWNMRRIYEKAAKQSAKAKDLKRSRFEGTGLLGGQVLSTTAFPTSDIWNNCTVKINPIDSDIYYLPRGERKRATRTSVELKLSPSITVTLPMIMHRPLPTDGEVTEIRLAVGKIMEKPIYKLLITVGFREIPIHKDAGVGVVGIDQGWAQDSSAESTIDYDGLLVGAIAGEHGSSLIKLDIGKQLHAQSVQSATDKEFDDIKKYILGKTNIPSEFNSLDKWRSHKKLRRTIINLHKAGSTFLDSNILNWLKHSKHRMYVEHIRQDAIEQRKHFYRNIASNLRKKYDTVVLENLSKSSMGRQGEVASTEAKTQFNWQLKTAALYQLELALINVGMKIVKVDPKFTSQTCASCGNVCKEARVTRSLYKCSKCGYENHADVNAAINIRSKGIERLDDARHTVLARSRTDLSIITNTYENKTGSKFAKKRKGMYRYQEPLANHALTN